MFAFLRDNRTQLDKMLDLLKSHKDGVNTDHFSDIGIRDHRSCKYKLTLQGWVIHTEQPKTKKGTLLRNGEGKYRLVGKICPKKKEKRDHLSGFTIEEIKSELFRRDQMSTIYMNGELYDIIKR